MGEKPVHACECDVCQTGQDVAGQRYHQQINLLLSRLDEQQRRWFAGMESANIGFGGDAQVARITGLDVETIRRGRREMAGDLEGRPVERVRLEGGGRPRVEKNSRT